jgi:hypothetical protein
MKEFEGFDVYEVVIAEKTHRAICLSCEVIRMR